MPNGLLLARTHGKLKVDEGFQVTDCELPDGEGKLFLTHNGLKRITPPLLWAGDDACPAVDDSGDQAPLPYGCTRTFQGTALEDERSSH